MHVLAYEFVFLSWVLLEKILQGNIEIQVVHSQVKPLPQPPSDGIRSTELRGEGRATTLPLDDGRRVASSGSPWSEKCVCVLGHVTCCCHIVKSEECVCVCVAVQPMYMHSRTSTHKRPRFHVLALTRIRIRTCCVTDAHEVSTCTRGEKLVRFHPYQFPTNA